MKMHKVNNSIPFRRMMLVDEMMLQKLKEEAITGYNPTAKSLVQHKDAMDSALQAKNGGIMSDERRLALYSLNGQRFRQLLRNAVNFKTGMLPALKAVTSEMTSETVQTDPTQTSTEGVQAGTEMSTQETETADLPSSIPYSPESTLAKQYVIPQQFVNKFNNVVSAIASNPKIINVSDENELVVGGKTIRGTSFADLIRSLFVDSQFPSTGLSHMVGALHHIGVTEDMLSSKRAKESMRTIAAKVLEDSSKVASSSAKPSPVESKFSLQGVARMVKELASPKQEGKGKRKAVSGTEGLTTGHKPPGKRTRVLRLYK